MNMNIFENLTILREAIEEFNSDPEIQYRYAGLRAEMDLLVSYIAILERRCREESKI